MTGFTNKVKSSGKNDRLEERFEAESHARKGTEK